MQTEQHELLKRHLHAAMTGAPLPAMRSAELGRLMTALQAPFEEGLDLAARNAALAQIGLNAACLLLVRVTSCIQAERELALLGYGRRPS